MMGFGTTVDRRLGNVVKMRSRRSIDELRKASGHLYYEWMMLFAMARVLATGASGSGPIHNALVESFVIHVRTVMDFLYAPANARADDVIADDFFDNPDDWTRSRPPLSAVLTRAKERAGKEMAHLTYARQAVTPEQKLWQFLDIEKEINEILGAFLRKVPKEKLGQEWEI